MSSVSFVTTIYNKAPYMAPMLDALAAQVGDFEREYIFVNDGSTDGSRDLLVERTKDWDNVTIIDQENQGPAVATNTGGLLAKHEYIKFIDADDVLAPDATHHLLTCLRNRDIDLIFGTFGTFSDAAKIQFLPEPREPAVTIYTDPIYTCLMGRAGSSYAMVCTAAFQKVGGCDQRVFIQDMSLALRMSLGYRIGETSHRISFHPERAPGRIMDNQAQMLHDLTFTFQNFVADNPDLPVAYKRLAFRRCAGRAWKWARRHHGASIFSRYLWLNAYSRLPLNGDFVRLIDAARRIWLENYSIRLPGVCG
jgi:glycosyltransferase involved in cell wall biosynthesis